MKSLSIVSCVLVWALTAAGYADGLEVVRVWPAKLLYAPEETARITVTLRNTAAADQQADLIVTVVTDVAAERELLRRAVTVAAGANEEVIINASLEEQFGHEIVAALMQDGHEVSRGREFFTVTDHAPLVSQYACGSVMAGTEKVIREQTIPGYRSNYITMCEIWMWSPSSFCDFAPKTEDWWGCERYVHYNRSTLKTYIAEAHKNGIKVFTYVNHAFWGRHSWEILREHPEWAMYLANGQWYARFNVEDTGGQSGVVPEDIYKMARCNASFVNMSAVDVGTDALIAGAEMWGYDGARWDGQWTVSGDYGTHDFYDINGKLNPRYPESDKHAVRNAKRYKARLLKARPGFLMGYNYGVRFKEGAGKFLPRFYKETVGDRGWLLWETAHPLLSGTEYGGATWQYAYEAMRDMATHARDAGGEMYAHAPTWAGAKVFNSYMCAIVFANRAHLSSPVTLGHWYKFAMRYGALLYDPRLEVAPAEGIKVEADAPLWWKDTVYRRKLSADKEQLIIHLINPPVNSKIDKKEQTAPTARRDVRVSVPVPGGLRLSAAWALSPDPDTHSEQLKASVARGIATVPVPELAFWDMLVFEFRKEGK
jgi:hypothetical protein